MGIAVFYKKKQLKMLTEDDLNHLVVLTPENGYVEYYFMATWELEWQPVNNITDFMNALDEELIRLNGLSYLKVSEKKDIKSLN